MRSIRNLVATLLYALPALANVGGLLLLVLFVYSALGAQLFFNVARRPDGFLNADANFDNFLMSALLLFRAMTGESWNGLMHDCMVQEDERGLCSEAEGTCSPHPFVAILFFFSFVIISVICLNLVIAVILEKKSAMSNENMLTKQELDHFQEVRAARERAPAGAAAPAEEECAAVVAVRLREAAGRAARLRCAAQRPALARGSPPPVVATARARRPRAGLVRL